MDLEDGAPSPNTESKNDLHVEVIVFALVTVLFWIIWTFYNTSSFLVRRLSRGKQTKVISSSSSHPTVQAIIDEVIDPIVQIQIKQFFGKIFEVLVLSLYHLVSVSLIISSFLYHIKHFGKHVDPPATNLTEATTQQLTADNVGQVFRNNTRYFETTLINIIYVYSCPLTAPFSSSTTSFRSVIQRQYLRVDYHAYIVFYTGQNESEMWWALDKHREGIFLSWGIKEDWVTHFFKGKPRAKPIQMLASDVTRSPVSDLARRLRKILKSNEYDLIEKNCQHFSKEIFDKFATDQKWEFTTPIDMTSPLSLTKHGFTDIIIAISILYELYLLFIKSRDNESFHYQYIVYVVTLVSLISLFFHDKLWYMPVHDLSGALLFFIVLPLEAVFYAPLYTIRKRGAQYRKMCRSGNIFYKCWLFMCFVMMYSLNIYLFFVCVPLNAVTHITSQDQSEFKLYLGFLFYYLTSLDFAVSTLHSIASWLFNIFCNFNSYSLTISCAVLSGVFLSLQE